MHGAGRVNGNPETKASLLLKGRGELKRLGTC